MEQMDYQGSLEDQETLVGQVHQAQMGQLVLKGCQVHLDKEEVQVVEVLQESEE